MDIALIPQPFQKVSWFLGHDCVDWEAYFQNANDGTNEGIIHKTKPFFSVQFHPEAKAGPTDTEWLFDKFAAQIRGSKFSDPVALQPPKPQVRKVCLNSKLH